jgi:hypothetical protein
MIYLSACRLSRPGTLKDTMTGAQMGHHIRLVYSYNTQELG